MRTLPLAVFLAAASTSIALAQHSPAVDQRGTVVPAPEELKAQETDVLFNNLRQQPVYESQAKAVGEIEDVLIDDQGRVRAVLIDIGRGGTPRLVAVPLTSLDIRKGPPGGRTTRTLQVFLKGGTAEIEKAPAFRAYLEN